MSNTDLLTYYQAFGFSGIGVAVITYLLTRRSKRSDNMTSFLEHKLTFFGSILFQFDKMRFTHDSVENRKMNYRDEEHPNTERYSYNSKEGESIFADINDNIQKNYSLFSQDLMKDWVDIRTQWHNPIVIEKAPKFRKALVEEYNNTAKKYNRITGIKLEQKS